MEGIKSWIVAEGTGHWFFVAFPVSLLILFIWFKSRRARFLIPSVLITLLIVNPWFYEKWDELGLYAYWRILWIVPVIPVVASLVPMISEKFGNKWIKGLVVGVGAVAIILGGTFVYQTNRGQFVEAANADKVPWYVAEIADKLLELKDKPRVIVQDPIGVYIRQYSGEIDTLYGRDMVGYIAYPSKIAKEISEIISNPEMDTEQISQFMIDDGYDYLVVANERKGKNLKYVDTVAGYYIYEAFGRPNVVKCRNELGQIQSITTVDEKGQPTNNIQGYATTAFSYDDNGYISSQFFSTSDGDGLGGSEMECDSYGRIVKERRLNEKGEPYVQEGGFVGYTQVYNSNGEVVSRQYVDLYGNQVQRTDGYSRVEWQRNIYDTQYIRFFDVDGNEVPIDGLNLATNIHRSFNEWSEWIEPEYNKDNYCISIGTLNLANKQAGDKFTCQIEIEFNNVKKTEGKEFYFRTQGHADGSWYIGNVWTSNLVYLTEPPENGVYRYTITNTVNEEMVSASTFDIGFRCDNWAAGTFRVRNIKIEIGDTASCWTPGI